MNYFTKEIVRILNGERSVFYSTDALQFDLQRITVVSARIFSFFFHYETILLIYSSRVVVYSILIIIYS